MIQMPQQTVFLPPMDIKAVCSTACVVTKQLPCFYLCECVCKCYLRGRGKDAQKQAERLCGERCRKPLAVSWSRDGCDGSQRYAGGWLLE